MQTLVYVDKNKNGYFNWKQPLDGGQLTFEGQPVDGIKVPYGQSFTVQMKPEKGFKLGSVKVRHGNLAATDSLINGMAQYVETDASELQQGVYLCKGKKVVVR